MDEAGLKAIIDGLCAWVKEREKGHPLVVAVIGYLQNTVEANIPAIMQYLRGRGVQGLK